MARVTRTHLLEDLLHGLEQIQHYESTAKLSNNYISCLTEVGTKKTPVLLISLSNGQHFEVRAKTLN